MEPAQHKFDKPPIVAVVASAIRVQEWPLLHDQLARTNVTPFVMLFAGHVSPNEPLPHLRHLFVDETHPPAFSVETAYRAAHGIASVEYILNLTDDAFLPDGLIDFLVARQREHAVGDVITGASFSVVPHEAPVPLLFHNGDPESPALTVFAMMKKSTSLKVGGIDRRFQGLYWDCDRVMRLYELGGHVANFAEVVTSEKPSASMPHGTLSDRFAAVDRALLNWLWTEDRGGGRCSKVRLDGVQPFPEDLDPSKPRIGPI
jgi:hypothetical protein